MELPVWSRTSSQTKSPRPPRYISVIGPSLEHERSVASFLGERPGATCCLENEGRGRNAPILRYSVGRVPRHAGYVLHPQNDRPLCSPLLATRRTMVLPQLGQEGTVDWDGAVCGRGCAGTSAGPSRSARSSLANAGPSISVKGFPLENCLASSVNRPEVMT